MEQMQQNRRIVIKNICFNHKIIPIYSNIYISINRNMNSISIILALTSLTCCSAFSTLRTHTYRHNLFALRSASPNSPNIGGSSENSSSSIPNLLNLLSNAEECAHSDQCSLDEALHYYSVLNDVNVNMSSGALAMEYPDQGISTTTAAITAVCEDLKVKLDRLEKAWIVRQTITTLTISAPILAVAMASAYSSYMIAHSSGATVPFEWNEVKMAFDGGYLDTMIGHFIRNGGL